MAALFNGVAADVVLTDGGRTVTNKTTKRVAVQGKVLWNCDQALAANIYFLYFEIQIVSAEKLGAVAIGLTYKDFPNSGVMPGWTPGSVGYHGDDGKLFIGKTGAATDSRAFGPLYGQNDVVGVGINTSTGHNIYTKNGEFIGFATLDKDQDFYPTFGMNCKATIKCNFSGPFKFSYLGYLIRKLSSNIATEQDGAAENLWDFTYSNTHKPQIVNEGGIPPLVKLLTTGTDRTKLHAAGELRNLSVQNKEIAALIVKEGAVAPLVKLASTGATDYAKSYAAAALASLANNESDCPLIAKAGGIPPLVKLLSVGTDDAKKYATEAIYNLTYGDAEVVEMAVKEGAVRPLIKMFSTEHMSIQTVTAIRNFATSESGRVLIAMEGGVAALIKLLSGYDTAITNQAAAALALLTNENEENKRTFGMEGGLPRIIKLLSAETSTTQSLAVELLFYLVFNKENAILVVKGGALPLLVNILKTGENALKKQVTALMAALTQYEDNREPVVTAGAVPPLVSHFASCGDDVVKDLIVRTFFFIHFTVRELIEKEGVLHLVIERLLLCDRLATGMMWGFADDINYRTLLVEKGIVPLLVKQLNSENSDLTFNAAGALCSISYNNVDRHVDAGLGEHEMYEIKITLGKGKKRECVVDCASLIVKEGALPMLIKFLIEGNENAKKTDAFKELAAVTLLNIMKNDTHKMQVVREGVVPPLIKLLITGREFGREIAVAALCCLSENALGREVIGKERGIPALTTLLNSHNEAVKMYTARALQLLGAGSLGASNDGKVVKVVETVNTPITIDIMISFHVASMKDRVIELRDKLRSLGYSVWVCLDIVGGAAFRDEIVRNVIKCSFFLALVNEGWANSHECVWECNIAQRRTLIFDKPIILPVFIGGFGWIDAEKYPLVYGMSCNTNGLVLQNEDWDDVFSKLIASMQLHQKNVEGTEAAGSPKKLPPTPIRKLPAEPPTSHFAKMTLHPTTNNPHSPSHRPAPHTPVQPASIQTTHHHSPQATLLHQTTSSQEKAPPIPPRIQRVPQTTITPHVAPQQAQAPPQQQAQAPTPPSPVRSFENKAVEDWTVDDVCNWLISIELEMHVSLFRESAVDGDILLTFDSELFNALGVKNVIHQHKIKHRLAKHVAK